MYVALKLKIISEMNKSLPIANSAKWNEKFKSRKPYWMDRLTVLHTNVDAKEREYVKFKGLRQHNINLHAEYKTARDIFDKELRIWERKFRN